MITENIDMTTSAEGHTSAGAEDRQIVGFTGFHDIEADIGRNFEVVGMVVVVDDFDVDQAVRSSTQERFGLRGQK